MRRGNATSTPIPLTQLARLGAFTCHVCQVKRKRDDSNVRAFRLHGLANRSLRPLGHASIETTYRHPDSNRDSPIRTWLVFPLTYACFRWGTPYPGGPPIRSMDLNHDLPLRRRSGCQLPNIEVVAFRLTAFKSSRSSSGAFVLPLDEVPMVWRAPPDSNRD